MLKSLFSKNTRAENESSIAHDQFFNELRAKEYSRLSRSGNVYLDYTGGGLYAESQIRAHQEMLLSGVFGNPHSTNPTSQLATKVTEEARAKVKSYFNAEDYYCIFTQNASGGLKIVGECYPFGQNCQFLLFSDNHNSVNGIREYCKTKGGSYKYVTIQYENLKINEIELEQELNAYDERDHKLLAYPAQSNVSGVKHDLAWVKKAQDKGWDVLLDAAAYVPSNRLDLKEIQPEFVTISFYKMFGYPTGLGCLLVKKEKMPLLQKQWFAGGTVTLAGVLSPNYYLANNHEKFENGTINYLGIPALKIGLDFIERIGIDRINERVTSLISYLYDEIKDLKHSTGNNQVNIFGPKDRSKSGGTIIMTFVNPDGKRIPFEVVEQMTNERMISIRSGCFCNPGIDEVNNCLTSEELSSYFTSHSAGDYKDMVAYLNKMRGATRVSVGLATTKEDLDLFVSFIKDLKDKTITYEMAEALQ